MISARRPSAAAVAAYRTERVETQPTVSTSGSDLHLQRDLYTRVIGKGIDAFDAARTGLQTWKAHTGSGIEVHPAGALLGEGQTVALVTRQAGLWVLMACRVVAVDDEPARFRFTYATLPGHPERGHEIFEVAHRTNDEVVFELTAVARPALALLQVGRPVTRLLQRRASLAYLDALERWVREQTCHP